MRNDTKLRAYSVGELAKLSGITIRTLHYYDAIGLLKPVSLGENSYRQYGREELLRLQQILFHRELGMSLADIAAVLNASSFDRLATLRRQRDRVLSELDRHRRLLQTIDRTIADLEGKRRMQDDDLYVGFQPEKQAAYEAYIVDRYGPEAQQHIETGRRRLSGMTPQAKDAHMAELRAVEADLAEAVAANVAADDPVLDPVLGRHHAWVATAWGSAPSGEAYAGLGGLYATHPDFVARYEAIQPGLAAWLQTAMAAFAERKLS